MVNLVHRHQRNLMGWLRSFCFDVCVTAEPYRAANWWLTALQLILMVMFSLFDLWSIKNL